MAVKIRLRRQGRKNREHFRIVAADSRSPRDGKFLENLGHYDPHNPDQSKGLVIMDEAVKKWVTNGAQISEKVEALIKRGSPELKKFLKERADKPKKKAAAKTA